MIRKYHNIYGLTVNKTTLSLLDTKRYITSGGITTCAYGCSQYHQEQWAVPHFVLVISNNKPVCPVLQWNNQFCIYINRPYWICCPSVTATFQFSWLIQIPNICKWTNKSINFSCYNWRGFFVSPFIALITSGNLITHSLLRLCGFCSSLL